MIRILTDTASDFDLEEAAELGVTMLPMEITIGDESFRDRYDLTPDRFYEMLIESSDLPHTSQINSYAFEQEYIKIQLSMSNREGDLERQRQLSGLFFPSNQFLPLRMGKSKYLVRHVAHETAIIS